MKKKTYPLDDNDSNKKEIKKVKKKKSKSKNRKSKEKEQKKIKNIKQKTNYISNSKEKNSIDSTAKNDNLESNAQSININKHNINKQMSISDRDQNIKIQNDIGYNKQISPKNLSKEETNEIIERIILELEEDKDELIKFNEDAKTEENSPIKIHSKKIIFLLKSKKK